MASYFAAHGNAAVKCICDAGMFLDVPTVTGAGNVMQVRAFDSLGSTQIIRQTLQIGGWWGAVVVARPLLSRLFCFPTARLGVLCRGRDSRRPKRRDGDSGRESQSGGVSSGLIL